MTKRIKVADSPEFDAAPYLDSEAAIAAYLTDILEANDPALLAAAVSFGRSGPEMSNRMPPYHGGPQGQTVILKYGLVGPIDTSDAPFRARDVSLCERSSSFEVERVRTSTPDGSLHRENR